MRAPEATLKAVREVLARAFGPDLDGSERGEMVSRFYLARIRDVVRETLPGAHAVPDACEDCADLRNRLANIYHLTLTYREAGETMRHIRASSGPGAQAQAALCGVDCLACEAGAR